MAHEPKQNCNDTQVFCVHFLQKFELKYMYMYDL